MIKKENEQKIDKHDAEEQVAKVCKRLALLHLSYAKTIINELGKEAGNQLVLKAIKDYGIRIGSAVKKEVEEKGSKNYPENYKEDLPQYGMHEKVEYSYLCGEQRIKSYGCVMGKLWHELGEDEIGRLYCYVDPAKYMAYNQDFALVHTKSIPDGDEYCEFKIRKTTKQEQQDFLNKDSDWSYIDKK